MSIRFTDLQVLLPRTIQAAQQAQNAAVAQGTNQHHGAAALQADSVKGQHTVQPGQESPAERKLEAKKEGGGGNSPKERRKQDGQEKEQRQTADAGLETLGSKIDIRA